MGDQSKREEAFENLIRERIWPNRGRTFTLEHSEIYIWHSYFRDLFARYDFDIVLNFSDKENPYMYLIMLPKLRKIYSTFFEKDHYKFYYVDSNEFILRKGHFIRAREIANIEENH